MFYRLVLCNLMKDPENLGLWKGELESFYYISDVQMKSLSH